MHDHREPGEPSNLDKGELHDLTGDPPRGKRRGRHLSDPRPQAVMPQTRAREHAARWDPSSQKACMVQSAMIRPQFARALVPLAIAHACALFSLSPSDARADVRTSFLVEQLKSSDDYRVRTQAALALGASNDDAAVQPLCGALSDSKSTVKVAAAAALGKLGRSGGVACLKTALAKEKDPSAKSQMEKSLASLEGAAPSIGAGAKYYVAVQVTNRTKRSASEVESMVRSAATARLLAKKEVAVAPKSESAAAASSILKSKKLKGFMLMAAVEAPVYEGGNLTQVVRVTVVTYPGKSIQAEFAPKLTQTGTPSSDPESEAVLIKMCIENAVDTFHKVAATL